MTTDSQIQNSSPNRILLVEDDPEFRQMLEKEFTEARYVVRATEAAEEAIALAGAWHPDLVISDLCLPAADGLALLRELQALPVPPATLIITAFGSIPQAVEALRTGADNFLTKPLDFEHLLIAVERALEVRRLKLEVQRFRLLESAAAEGLLGQSKPMRLLAYQIQQIARAPGPVLIVGESGVGKELVAHALHEHSERRRGPFVAVNCAGLPETLLESELFGHAAGAFTGARRLRRGLFAEADRGVLFLDEVTELPPAMQAKLLRVLQEQTIRPVGANEETPVDVRVLAASNRDLAQEVREKRFRQDLYYRLETFVLRVPPLREREGDLELLAARFLARYSREAGKAIQSFSAEALRALRQYSFPGNVRELQNAIQRAVAFCHGDTLQLEDLPESFKPSGLAPGPAARRGLPTPLLDGSGLPTLEEMKTRYVQYVLDRTHGNKRRAAALLGVGRHTLYSYLAKQKGVQFSHMA